MRLIPESTLNELWEHHIYMTTVMRALGVDTPRTAAESVVELQEMARENHGVTLLEVQA